jgi:cytochrome c oxidase subunit II
MNTRRTALSVILLAVLMSETALLGGDLPSGPKRIEVTAGRWEYSPAEVTVKKGQPVTLVLHTRDVAHSLMVKRLNISAEIPKQSVAEVTFKPDAAGNFEGRCDHFCGTGHESMRFVIRVVE